MNNNIRKLVDDNWDEIKELIAQKAEAEQKTKTIWDLDTEDSEEYYYICSDGDICWADFNSRYAQDTRDMGVAFLTREKANFEAERRRVEAILRKYSKPFKLNEGNYVIKHNVTFKMVEIGLFATTDYGIPYFESEEIAKKAINEIGEDRLIKYWFKDTE